MYTYEYECEPCGELIFEEVRNLTDRNRLATCPLCGNKSCKKIMSRTQFNAIFPGSTKHEALADHWTRESIRAQEEGFSSKDEIQTAIGMAEERAKQMGQPGKQLIGPVSTPYVGEKYVPTQDEVLTAGKLVERKLKAIHAGDTKAIAGASQALKEHEGTLKTKAATKAQKFMPKNSKEELKKQIKAAQSQRGW